MKRREWWKRAALSLLGLLLSALLVGSPARAQVGVYTLELTPDQWVIIQRGPDHARIVYSPPNPDPALVSSGLDRPTILINCTLRPAWQGKWFSDDIHVWLDAAGHARIEGKKRGKFFLKIIDFGAGPGDSRQWVITYPVPGNNGAVPRTCGP